MSCSKLTSECKCKMTSIILTLTKELEELKEKVEKLQATKPEVISSSYLKYSTKGGGE